MTEDYAARFHSAGHELMSQAHRLKAALEPCDVWGLYFAVGIELMRLHEPDERAAEWLRDLADAIERGEGDQSRWGHA